MSEINETNESKLFNKPTVTRDEPKVEANEVNLNTENNQNDELADYAKDISSLLDGFSSILGDYKKLLEILTIRANMLGVKLDTSGRKDDQALSNALVVLYGSADIPEISFSDYVDLLKYEQTTAGAYIATTINLENAFDDVDEILKDGLTKNPAIQAVGTIKEQFTKVINDSGYPQLFMAESLVKKIADVESSLSSVSEANKLSDGESVIDKAGEVTVKAKEDKIRDAIKECIPCAGRSFNLAEDFSKTQILNVYIELMFKKFFANLKELARIKLSIIGVYFSHDICRIIDLIGNNVCVPDLRMIIILLKSVIMNIMKLLKTEFSNVEIGVPAAPMGAFINAGLDALLLLLTKLFGAVFSSVECVLTSLQLQIDKLNGTDELSDLLSILDIDNNIGTDVSLLEIAQDNRTAATDFFYTLNQGHKDLKAMFHGTTEQILKKLRFNLFSDENVINLYEELDKVKNYISLLQEILSVKEALSKVDGSGDWDKLGKAICAAAFSGKYPWLNYVDNIITELEDDMFDDDDDKDDDDGTGTGGTGDVKDDDENNIVVLDDDSIPPSFFDDDPFDYLDDDYISDIWNNMNYDHNPEDGEDLLKLNSDLIDKYKKTKADILSLRSAINNAGGRDTISALPVIKLNFSKCLESNNLEGFSASEIQEWINKINS